MLWIEATDVVIDSTVYGNSARFANHWCQPKANFKRYFLDSTRFSVVFIVAVVDIPRSAEFIVDYVWNADAGQTVAICESRAETCKNYI